MPAFAAPPTFSDSLSTQYPVVSITEIHSYRYAPYSLANKDLNLSVCTSSRNSVPYLILHVAQVGSRSLRNELSGRFAAALGRKMTGTRARRQALNASLLKGASCQPGEPSAERARLTPTRRSRTP